MVLCAVVVGLAPVHATQPGFDWIYQFGNESFTYAHGTAVGGDGSRFVVGTVSYGALGDQTAAGYADVYIRRFEADGTPSWLRQFGTSASDDGYAVAVGSDGVYVSGSTSGTLPGQVQLPLMSGGRDAFVRKYAFDGTELWTRQFGTPSQDDAVAVAVDDSGVYVAGSTRGQFLGQTQRGGVEGFVQKFSPRGWPLWTRQFGNDHAYFWTGITAAAPAHGGNGVIVAGTTEGPLPGQTFTGWIDGYVRRYDRDGNIVWTDQFGTSQPPYGSGGYDKVTAVSSSAAGVFVAGYVGDNAAFAGETARGRWDAFVRAYSSDGVARWTRQFGTEWDDLALAVASDDTGVVVGGELYGSLDSAASYGSWDGVLRRYDVEGVAQWTQQIGTTTFDRVTALAIADGAMSVAGETGGAFDGFANVGPYPNAQFEDTFVASRPAA